MKLIYGQYRAALMAIRYCLHIKLAFTEFDTYYGRNSWPIYVRSQLTCMYAIGNCALCLPMVDRTAIWVLTFSAPIPYGKEKETRASSCRFIFDIFSLPSRRHRRTDAQSFALLASSTDQPNLLPRSSEPYCGYADSWNGCTEGRRVSLARQRSWSRL